MLFSYSGSCVIVFGDRLIGISEDLPRPCIGPGWHCSTCLQFAGAASAGRKSLVDNLGEQILETVSDDISGIQSGRTASPSDYH